jgi:hypothetical protein
VPPSHAVGSILILPIAFLRNTSPARLVVRSGSPLVHVDVIEFHAIRNVTALNYIGHLLRLRVSPWSSS